MRQSFWDKRFPTLFGLLFIAISALGIAYVSKSPQLFELGATGTLTFQDLRVSNQTPTSLSISFTTKDPAAIQLQFGQNRENTSTLFDDRDEIGGKVGSYRTHHFTPKNLSPGTQYVFAIIAQAKIYDNGGSGFVVKTAPASSGSGSGTIDPVRGTVLTSSGRGATDAIVFVKVDGGGLLSTVVKSEGRFLLPLTDIYNADLTSRYSFTGNEVFSIEAIGEGEGPTAKTAPFGTQGNLETLILGGGTSGLLPPDVVSQAVKPVSSGFQIVDPLDIRGEETTIVSPEDGDSLIDAKPLFRGRGIPSQRVEIVVESEQQQTADIVVGEDGNWAYQPDDALAPGKHTVLVRFFDGENVTKVIQNQFEVFASGLAVAEPATPSPTTTQIVLSPVPTAVPPLPNTGTTMPGFAVGVAGFLFAFTGFLAFRLNT